MAAVSRRPSAVDCAPGLDYSGVDSSPVLPPGPLHPQQASAEGCVVGFETGLIAAGRVQMLQHTEIAGG